MPGPNNGFQTLMYTSHSGILLKCRFEFSEPAGQVEIPACPASCKGTPMLLVYEWYLSGRDLEDLSPPEQISFALFRDNRLHSPTSEVVQKAPNSQYWYKITQTTENQIRTSSLSPGEKQQHPFQIQMAHMVSMWKNNLLLLAVLFTVQNIFYICEN